MSKGRTTMPQKPKAATAKLSHPVLDLAQELLHRKGEDYNGDAVSFSNRAYFPFAHASYLTMLHIKLERLKSLVSLPEDKSQNFESSLDSVVDLINYAAMYGAFLMEENHESE